MKIGKNLKKVKVGETYLLVSTDSRAKDKFLNGVYEVELIEVL